MDERLNISNEDFSLPKWANEMYILGEKEEIAKQIKIENKIGELQVKLINQKYCIEEIQKYKLLLTASGGLLEEITKKVLGELGFSLLNAEKGRSDIAAKYGDLGIVDSVYSSQARMAGQRSGTRIRQGHPYRCFRRFG